MTEGVGLAAEGVSDMRKDCEPSEGGDCEMTATAMAEHLATSGYLEDMRADIETALDRGM